MQDHLTQMSVHYNVSNSNIYCYFQLWVFSALYLGVSSLKFSLLLYIMILSFDRCGFVLHSCSGLCWQWPVNRLRFSCSIPSPPNTPKPRKHMRTVSTTLGNNICNLLMYSRTFCSTRVDSVPTRAGTIQYFRSDYSTFLIDQITAKCPFFDNLVYCFIYQWIDAYHF